ncbi:MAG: hypothetical protein HQL39_12400, partial [Alphaproteobacteria bacterium]|nr:hypothetical protein [Alphaproteobacteria bacterium]
MALTGLVPAARRHPWLDAVMAAPLEQVHALIDGRASIPPYQGAEPADAAVSLLFGLDDDAAARRAFDEGCLALLQSLRADLLSAEDDRRRLRLIASFDRLIPVIRRTKPRGTLLHLFRRYAWWLGVFETAIVDRSLDLRREFSRLIALT